jgi:hypothetical protein
MQAHTRPLHRVIPNVVDMLMSKQKTELFRRAAVCRRGWKGGHPTWARAGGPYLFIAGQQGCRAFIQKVEIGAITKNPPASASGDFFDNTQPL